MANIADLNVAIGASIDEAGFKKGEQAIAGLGTTAAAASAQVASAAASMAGGIDVAAGRFVDSAGRIRSANGQFVSSAPLAAEAAGNVGGQLGALSGKASQAAATFSSKAAARLYLRFRVKRLSP